MGAITPTKTLNTEFSGNAKIGIFTATLGSASDTVALADYFDTIYFAVPVLSGGADAALLAGLQTSFSGTTVTIVSQEQDGTPSTNWTGATLTMLVVGDN